MYFFTENLKLYLFSVKTLMMPIFIDAYFRAGSSSHDMRSYSPTWALETPLIKDSKTRF